jgi:heptosyltransferase-1
MAGRHTFTPLHDRIFKRLLIVKPSSLGDIVHALPVLHGLRRRYPSARIDWLANTGLSGLLEGHPELDEVVPFHRARYAGVWRSPGAAMDFTRFLRDLRQRRYDLVIDLQGLFRTGFITRMTGASVRLGFREAREMASIFYTHYIEDSAQDRHAVDRYYGVAAMLGFDDVPINFNWGQTESDLATAGTQLATHGLSGQQRWVAVVPGARWETKLWPEHKFAEVIDQLQSVDGIPCIVLGGPDECDRCRRLCALCRTQPINLCGRTNVREFSALIGLASSVLCLDSAAAHLAVAMQRPMVTITGPTDPRRTGPYNRPHDVVRLDLPCSPCFLRRLRQCPHRHRCLVELESGPVLEAVRQSLKTVLSPIQSIEGSAMNPAVRVPGMAGSNQAG